MDFIEKTKEIFTGWISKRKLERYLNVDFIKKTVDIFTRGFYRGN